MSTQPDVLEKLVSLCKRRGYIFQSSEIYGGTGSVWDYGPLGVELKKNIKDRWWNAMVRSRDDVEGLDAAILMHPGSGRRVVTSLDSWTRLSIAKHARVASVRTSWRTRTVCGNQANTPANFRNAN